MITFLKLSEQFLLISACVCVFVSLFIFLFVSGCSADNENNPTSAVPCSNTRRGAVDLPFSLAEERRRARGESDVLDDNNISRLVNCSDKQRKTTRCQLNECTRPCTDPIF